MARDHARKFSARSELHRMTFQERYRNLEAKFEEQVKKDHEYYSTESEFLPNLAPPGTVNFVLIAMEPSGGKSQEEIANHPGLMPKNFCGSVEDFILHHSIRNYLCRCNESYYLTDLSKGSMPVKMAGIRRLERYQRWYPLLEQEIELVANPGAPIIPIGNYVGWFLKEQGMKNLQDRILHYSQSAGHARKKKPARRPDQYQKFKETVSWGDIESTVRQVLNDAGMAEHIPGCLERFRRGSKLTGSRRKLMFTYKVQFEKIREKAGLD